MHTNPEVKKEDMELDTTLRPRLWHEYIGQERTKENLRIIIEAAKKRTESIEHLLIYGGPGLGKTSLAYIIAREMGTKIKATSGPAIEKAGDLASILTNLSDGDIIFIDECHRMNKIVEEMLYPAMEDFKLDLILGRGPMAKTMELKLPRFTLIGATTRIGLLTSPLRSRFGATFRLDFYKIEDVEKIIRRSSQILNIGVEDDAIKTIASSSRFTPRVANRLLKRVRDFAQVRGNGTITNEITKNALELLEIDELGLEPADRRIIEVIIKKFEGGPVGLQALSAAASEEEDTILDIYEPYLMQIGLLERTPRGRMATPSAYKHLKEKNKNQNPLI